MIDTVDCRSSSTADILNILEDFKGQQVKLEYFSWFGTVGKWVQRRLSGEASIERICPGRCRWGLSQRSIAETARC
jgi:hypothetical protein